MSTSNAWATWVRCLYPSPFTHPQVLIITPEAFASTKNYNNIKFWEQKIFQHLIYLQPIHALPNLENAPVVNLFSQNVTLRVFHYWLLAGYHWNFKRELLQTLSIIPYLSNLKSSGRTLTFILQKILYNSLCAGQNWSKKFVYSQMHGVHYTGMGNRY